MMCEALVQGVRLFRVSHKVAAPLRCNEVDKTGYWHEHSTVRKAMKVVSGVGIP